MVRQGTPVSDRRCPPAKHGIDIIVQEGEGTSTDPFQSPGDPAHYYKFGEISDGRKIIPKAAAASPMAATRFRSIRPASIR